MPKKDFASDLQNFVKKGEPGTEVPAVETPEREKAIEKETPRSVGRPKEHEPYEKTTVTFPSEMMGKLRMLCVYEGRQIREVLEEALGRLIDEYEQEHGAIRVPPRFRNDKK